MKAVIRLSVLVAALAGLAYGFAWETRTIDPIVEEAEPAEEAAEADEVDEADAAGGADGTVVIDGLGFIEGATTDAYILRDGRLLDAYSLKPPFAQVKDCKT